MSSPAIEFILQTFWWSPLLYLILGSAPVNADPVFQRGGAPLAQRLQRLVDESKLGQSHFGIWVTRRAGEEESPVFTLNGEKKMTPASLTKIVTAAASLENFPKSHRFLTTLKANAPIRKGVLEGSIYLVGGGDPGFISESMWFLVNEFTRQGVTKIQGDIIVDDSLFDDIRFDPSRSPERVVRAYDAPVGAMSFNWNSLNVYVRPGSKKGQPAQVIADPKNSYVQVLSEVKTQAGHKKSVQVQRVRVNLDSQGPKEVFRVKGVVGDRIEELVKYVNISKPAFWSAYNLREFLSQRGIKVVGSIKRGKVPSTARVLAEAESKSPGLVVADMMKFSNNYVAEMLTKNLAVQSGARPGTMEVGLKVLREYLKSQGLRPQDFSLVNPSGLTHHNKFRPKDLHRVLSRLHSTFPLFPEFASSLPVAGVDGTLKSRMVNGKAKDWVLAKTGLLRGVVGLAGFAGCRSGEVFTFVFIYNGKDRKTLKARQLFDHMAEGLVRC